MSVLSSFLISLLFEEKILFPLFSFLGSVAASYHVVNSRQRSTFLKVGVFLGVVNIAAILSLNLLTGRLLDDLILRLAMGLFGGIITGILVAGLTPVFESLFGFITYIKLLELANLNQPLFQKMIIEAPGTYHHSIIVASLVESAAEAIVAMHLPRWELLAAILVMVVILGSFLPPVSIILMTAPIILPPLKAAGFDLVWFGVVMTIVMEMGLIHPPVGLNLFVIKNIAPDIPLSDVIWGTIPFVILMMVAVVLVCLAPGIATWMPDFFMGAAKAH